MSAIFLLLLVAVATFEHALSANWCGLASCGTKQHIDCTRGDGSLGENCLQQVNVTMLSLQDATTGLVNTFNTYRNAIATGQKTGFDPAVRMATLRWNVTLANLARENVRNCVSQHDGCRNTPDFNFVGQALGYSKHAATDPRTNYQIILDIIGYWTGELANATMANMNKYTGNPPSGKISEACQLARDDASRVGCAALKYVEPDDSDHVLLFACNFDVANIYNYPVYKAGPTASKCTTGKNTAYPGLCSLTEPINPNKFWP